METKNQSEQFLSSVKNALRILNSFSMEEPEKKVSDLSASLGLNKSTVSRTLSTLASEGFVYKDSESRQYRLGLSLLTLSGIVNSQMDIYQEAQPILNKLVETLGETAHLSILDHSEVIYIQKVECNHPVRVLTHVGKRNPAYCTSSGKVLLAYSDEEVVETVIKKGLKAYTSKTITNPNTLRSLLKKVREDGFALSSEDFLEGVNSIAAPIYDHRGKVIASIATVGPKQRIQPSKIPYFTRKVVNAAMDISHRMGYRP